MSNSDIEEPHNKQKTSLSFPLSSLPDELALSCLARVSRSDCAALSLVSKRHHSLVVSPEFYKTRSLLLFAKKCFYVCLRTRDNSTPLWFMLSREKTVNRFMSQIPSFPFQPPVGSSIVALDWGIYVIGGLINEKPTSDVLLLDCRTHTWRKLPYMGLARAKAVVGVINGKIYVIGGLEDSQDNDSSNRLEIFDPKTQTWDTFMPMLDDSMDKEKEKQKKKGNEKVYEVVCGKRKVYYYNHVILGGNKSDYEKLGILSYCSVIENVLYSCDGYGKLFWRKLKESEWKEVKGLETLQIIFAKYSDDSELRKFGENIMLVWFKYSDDHKNVEIWCAEVSFERREEKGKIWGKMEWSEAVATLDRDLFDFKIDVLCFASVNV